MLRPNGLPNQVAVLKFAVGLLGVWFHMVSLAAQEPATVPATVPATEPAKALAVEIKPDDKNPQEKPAKRTLEAKVAKENKAAEAVQAFAAPLVVVGVAMEGGEGEAVDVQIEANADIDLADGLNGRARVGDPAVAKLLTRVAVDNALIRRVCKPNDQQLEQLKKFDAKWVSAKAKTAKVAGNIGGGFLRAVVGGIAGAQQAQQIDPAAASKSVISAHRKELEAILTKEQLAEFETAILAREKFRSRANAECVVALLDDRLFLTYAQRDELATKLEAWKGIQNLQPHFYFQNHSYIPMLPAEVSKALNESQRKVLAGMQQVDFQGAMFGQEIEFFIEN